MRKILYRGKSKRTNKWVYGYLVELGKESFTDDSKYGIIEKAIPILNEDTLYNVHIEEIIPETAGQYTILRDIHKDRIFEGDIVEILPTEEYGIIKWDNDTASFIISTDSTDATFNNYWSTDLEIKGNIHDSPDFFD